MRCPSFKEGVILSGGIADFAMPESKAPYILVGIVALRLRSG